MVNPLDDDAIVAMRGQGGLSPVKAALRDRFRSVKACRSCVPAAASRRHADGRRLTGLVEVFDVLNANPEQTISWETGALFLRPLVSAPPRIMRIGAKLEW